MKVSAYICRDNLTSLAYCMLLGILTRLETQVKSNMVVGPCDGRGRKPTSENVGVFLLNKFLTCVIVSDGFPPRVP